MHLHIFNNMPACESKKEKNKRINTAKLLLLLFIASIFLYYFFVTKPLIKTLLEEKARANAVDVINTANVRIEQFFSYGELFTFVTDNEGMVAYIKSNNKLINQINMLASTEIQNLLNASQNITVYLPIGAFTGSAMLTSKGEKIKLDMVSVGTCDTRMRSAFNQAGINQVLHRLLIDVYITVEIISPWKCKGIKVWYEIVLAENVFASRVPATFINTLQDSYFDLIPKD